MGFKRINDLALIKKAIINNYNSKQQMAMANISMSATDALMKGLVQWIHPASESTIEFPHKDKFKELSARLRKRLTPEVYDVLSRVNAVPLGTPDSALYISVVLVFVRKLTTFSEQWFISELLGDFAEALPESEESDGQMNTSNED